MNTSGPDGAIAELYAAARREIAKVIVGQDDLVEQVLVAMFAGGHVLIEGVPGLGKTLSIVTNQGRWCRYNDAANTWTVLAEFPNGSDSGATFVYHPLTKKLYAAGMTSFSPPKMFDPATKTVKDFPMTELTVEEWVAGG